MLSVVCMMHCFEGESPYASHLLYTQPNVLDDSIPEERNLGIEAGFAWKHQAGVLTVFYTDCGWSQGMMRAQTYCIENNLPYEIRSFTSSEDIMKPLFGEGCIW